MVMVEIVIKYEVVARVLAVAIKAIVVSNRKYITVFGRTTGS